MRNVLLLCFFLLSLSSVGQPVKDHGHLKIGGGKLLDESGKPVVLRGMSYGWHCLWPRFYNAGSVDWLVKDWGVTVVRAALGVELGKDSYLKRPDWSREKIVAVVEEAIRMNVYVIIDWHSHNIQLEEAKAFFRDMATRFGKNPHVIYEIFNEPDYESWKEVKDYSIEVIKVIREIDPDNIIIVGSPHWDQDVQLPADDPITGYDNLIYSLHYYAATHNQPLRDRADYALSKGLPLFISESAAVEATGDGPLNVAEWQKWIDWAEKHQLSWITWSISDKEETCSVLLPTASSEGAWKDDQMRESGIRAREMIRKLNNWKQ